MKRQIVELNVGIGLVVQALITMYLLYGRNVIIPGPLFALSLIGFMMGIGLLGAFIVGVVASGVVKVWKRKS